MPAESQHEFRPPPWIASPHIQSLLASTRVRRAMVNAAGLRAAAVPEILDCGDGVRLLAHRSRPAVAADGQPLAVLIHGWEGSSESSYLLAAATRLFRAGVEVVRLNLRDHGGTHHLNPDLFHSCRLDEALGAVAAVARGAGDRPLYLVGWSLGGNFAVRIAHRAPEAGIHLAHAVAISPVVDPAHSYDAMQNGLFVYRQYFIRKWKRALLRKQAAFPERYDFGAVLRMNDLRAMTAHLVAQFGEFADVDEYFAGYALSRDMLEGASQPLTVITAADDPVIPGTDFAPFRSGGNFQLEVHTRGGHCGFMSSLGAHSWIDERLERIIAAA